MFKALLIGCGNIGALYDFDNDQVLTHAKAYHLHPGFKLSVYDIDRSSAEKVANKYTAQLIDDLSSTDFSSFDCISVCTPTQSHCSFLERAFSAGTKVIVCEKPVSYSLEELDSLSASYRSSSSKVIVNYIRRFQPAYKELKLLITAILLKEKLTSITIDYHRGFLNNCSHALDLVEFLFDRQISFNGAKITNATFESFKDDPTLSVEASWFNVNLKIEGKAAMVFELHVDFESTRVSISDFGQKIIVSGPDKDSGFLLSLKSMEDCLNNYMEPVIRHVYDILNGAQLHDNFMQSVSLNRKMLTLARN